MKIAIVYLGVFPPETGGDGAQRRVGAIAKGLAAQDRCSTTMLIPRRSGGECHGSYGGFILRYLGPIRTGKNFIGARFGFWREVQKVCTTEGFDWVLFYSVTVDAIWTMRDLRRCGVKVASEMCDLRSSGISPSGIADRFVYLVLKADEALVPRFTDLNIVISSFLEHHVRKQAPSVPAVRLPILCDPDVFKPRPDATEYGEQAWGVARDDFVIGYVGGLWSNEGVRYLLEAFKDVSARNDRARLIIAGSLETGPGFDDVTGIAGSFEIADKVVTLGWVGTDDVLAIYTRADIMVLPQSSDKFSVAGLPTKLAEYSLLSKAILATRVGDVPSYFEDELSALIVPPDDSKALASAIERLAESEALRKKLGAAAHAVAKAQFDPRAALGRVAKAMAQISKTGATDTLANAVEAG